MVDLSEEAVQLVYSVAVGARVRGWHGLSRREVICIGGPDVDHGFDQLVWMVRQSLRESRRRRRRWELSSKVSAEGAFEEFDKAAIRSLGLCLGTRKGQRSQADKIEYYCSIKSWKGPIAGWWLAGWVVAQSTGSGTWDKSLGYDVTDGCWNSPRSPST